MVLLASDATLLTTDTILTNDSTDLQTEVSLAENRIRAAAGIGLYTLIYNAKIIGNPQVDPRSHTDLPPSQINFFDLFTAAGYTVSVDTSTGFWVISWNSQGAETLVQIYTFRTTFDPSTVTTQTINAIQAFFTGLRPTIHSTVHYNGFIDEAGFGGTTSQYFEFTVVVDQQDPTDLAAGLKLALLQQGLGYTSNNSNVYRLVV